MKYTYEMKKEVDRNNPNNIRYYYVKRPTVAINLSDKFKGIFKRDNSKKSSLGKLYTEKKSLYKKNKSAQKENSQKTKNESESPYNDQEITQYIASEVQRIMKENERARNANGENKTKQKRVSKPRPKSKKLKNTRYTVPKERAIVVRIINRLKYECGHYNRIEDDLLYKECTFRDVEKSRISEKRKDKKLYKKVQAYEDARDDVVMKNAFFGIKITAAAALLVASIWVVDNIEKDFKSDSAVTQSEDQTLTLNTAIDEQIQKAERTLSGIEYNFEYLTNDELVDGILRIQEQASKITENKARATISNIGLSSDQQLLKDILEEVYEEENYNSFSDEEMQELMQLTYELLDENSKGWIRSPERVAEAIARQENSQNNKNTEIEIGD